jgi:Flp pilus assembly protein TadG
MTPGLERSSAGRPLSDDGLVTTEMAVVMVTFFAGFLMLVMYAGRVGQSENDVQSAAHEAARAATLEATPAAADTRARAVAASNLAASGISCTGGLIANVDTTDFVPGGWVTVTLSCNTPFADVASLNVPGSLTFNAAAAEVIDIYRSDP